jgi:hypothetical protein
MHVHVAGRSVGGDRVDKLRWRNAEPTVPARTTSLTVQVWGAGGGCTKVPKHTEETKAASEELLKKFPLIKVEGEGAGGLNFPSVSFRILAIYLIGAK